jgi:hypothetical protein
VLAADECGFLAWITGNSYLIDKGSVGHQPVLTEDIQKVDEIYLWFVKLKEENIAQRH